MKLKLKSDYFSNGSGRARKLLIPAFTEIKIDRLTVTIPGRKRPLKIKPEAIGLGEGL